MVKCQLKLGISTELIKRMNILNGMLLKGNAGTENAFIQYGEALQSSKFNVINLIHQKAQIIPKLEQKKLTYIKSKFLGKFGKKDIFTILYFKYLIKKHKINTVLAHHGRLISLFKTACPKHVKLIAINHGYNPKHAVGTDIAITLNSTAYKNTISLGQPKQKTVILPHSINFRQNSKIIHPTPLEDTIYIGSYGRFSPEKGYQCLIKALKILSQNNIKFKALIGGSGADESLLKTQVKKSNLEKQVNFIGWVQDKESFYKKINLFISPSNEEEFSITILEAMKYYTPVLATKCDGPSDIIEDQNTGFLTDINKPKKMAEKIEYIKNNSSLLQQIALNAYHQLSKKYAVKTFQENLQNIVKNE